MWSLGPLALLGLSLWLVGCRGERATARAVTKARPPQPAKPSLPTIEDGRGLLFLFFDRRAELRTVDRIAAVGATARAAVQVVDPAHPVGDDRIVVTDLRVRGGQDGTYRRWLEKRDEWLARTMPRVSELGRPLTVAKVVAKVVAKKVKTPRRVRPRPRRRKPRAARSHPDAGPARVAAQKRPGVLLFSTTWCPSCRAARAYFTERRVAFREFDVEKDSQAAQHFTTILTTAGLRPGVVPLIVVGQRAFQGFSRARMEEVLQRLGVLPKT